MKREKKNFLKREREKRMKKITELAPGRLLVSLTTRPLRQVSNTSSNITFETFFRGKTTGRAVRVKHEFKDSFDEHKLNHELGFSFCFNAYSAELECRLTSN